LQLMTASKDEASGAQTTAATRGGQPISARLSYGAGPLSAGLALTKNGVVNGANPGTVWNLGGSYDLGVAKIKAQYERDNGSVLVGGSDIGNSWLVGAEGGIPGTPVVLK